MRRRSKSCFSFTRSCAAASAFTGGQISVSVGSLRSASTEMFSQSNVSTSVSRASLREQLRVGELAAESAARPDRRARPRRDRGTGNPAPADSPPTRACGRAGRRPRCRRSCAAERVAGIGLLEDGVGLLRRGIYRARRRWPDACSARMAAGEERGVLRARHADGERGDGTPAGICTIESSESRPLSVFDCTGTPSTGSEVFEAVMPGRWAAPPAPAMMTSRPRCGGGGVFEQQVGVRWAETTRTSCGNAELLECLGGGPHRVPVRLRAHDDADERFHCVIAAAWKADFEAAGLEQRRGAAAGTARAKRPRRCRGAHAPRAWRPRSARSHSSRSMPVRTCMSSSSAGAPSAIRRSRQCSTRLNRCVSCAACSLREASAARIGSRSIAAHQLADVLPLAHERRAARDPARLDDCVVQRLGQPECLRDRASFSCDRAPRPASARSCALRLRSLLLGRSSRRRRLRRRALCLAHASRRYERAAATILPHATSRKRIVTLTIAMPS